MIANQVKQNGGGRPQQAQQQPAGKEPGDRWGIHQRIWMQSHQNASVELATTDGKILRGRLVGYEANAVVVETKGGDFVCVWKSALKYARPAHTNGDAKGESGDAIKLGVL